jgi:hypothetical protein
MQTGLQNHQTNRVRKLAPPMLLLLRLVISHYIPGGAMNYQVSCGSFSERIFFSPGLLEWRSKKRLMAAV